jgi:hypothetical protein
MIVQAGPIVLDVCNGLSPGDDVIELEREEDAVHTEVGADGKMVVSLNTNKSGTITVKCSQTSPNNAKLLAIADLQAGGPATFVPCSVGFQDPNRQDVAGGMAGVIVKLPKMVRGVNASQNDWKIKVEDLSMILGNPAIPLLAQGLAAAAGGT